jgi:hypothetical protein
MGNKQSGGESRREREREKAEREEKRKKEKRKNVLLEKRESARGA